MRQMFNLSQIIPLLSYSGAIKEAFGKTRESSLSRWGWGRKSGNSLYTLSANSAGAKTKLKYADVARLLFPSPETDEEGLTDQQKFAGSERKWRNSRPSTPSKKDSIAYLATVAKSIGIEGKTDFLVASTPAELFEINTHRSKIFYSAFCFGRYRHLHRARSGGAGSSLV